jgi:hypothetical protein
MGIRDLIESRIQDAMAAGDFDNLPGAGKPLRLREGDALAGENALGYTILSNGGHLPEWLLLAKEIEQGQAELDRLVARHAEWVAISAERGEWERNAGILRRTRAAIEERARSLRKKQDKFNFDAPLIALERPSIWVEHVLAAVEATLRDAGAPECLIAPSV